PSQHDADRVLVAALKFAAGPGREVDGFGPRAGRAQRRRGNECTRDQSLHRLVLSGRGRRAERLSKAWHPDAWRAGGGGAGGPRASLTTAAAAAKPKDCTGARQVAATDD